ncbi:MAG: hypothetical protein ACI8RD_009884 [Bacillariaceae sp.]|jgi:hypothetical protein
MILMMQKRASFLYILIVLSIVSIANGFLLQQQPPTVIVLFESLESETTQQPHLTANPEIAILKSDLIEIADRTKRGFYASSEDKTKAKEIVESLQLLNPTRDPATDYYDPSSISSVNATSESNNDSDNDNRIGISGKWELIYTDAPDITSLDSSRNPFSTAKLGRIGQQCDPPYIKNIIEWKRPDWAENLPFSGSSESRILQKVVVTAVANPSKPTFVELKVAGIEVMAAEDNDNDDDDNDSSSNSNPSSSMIGLVENIQKKGIPVGILGQNPIDLKGNLNPPFGRFEILYLDNELRIIRTNQNFIAVNRRINKKEDEWF